MNEPHFRGWKSNNKKTSISTLKVKYPTCVSDSFIVGEKETACIAAGAGAYCPLKEVIGYAASQTGYKCIDFNLPF